MLLNYTSLSVFLPNFSLPNTTATFNFLPETTLGVKHPIKSSTRDRVQNTQKKKINKIITPL